MVRSYASRRQALTWYSNKVGYGTDVDMAPCMGFEAAHPMPIRGGITLFHLEESHRSALVLLLGHGAFISTSLKLFMGALASLLLGVSNGGDPSSNDPAVRYHSSRSFGTSKAAAAIAGRCESLGKLPARGGCSSLGRGALQRPPRHDTWQIWQCRLLPCETKGLAEVV